MGMYDKCPCRFCEPPERHPGCHGKCEKKLAWDNKVRVYKEKLWTEQKKDYHANGFIKDSQRRMAKIVGKKG